MATVALSQDRATGKNVTVTHSTEIAGTGADHAFFTLVDGGAAESSGAFDTDSAACQ